MEWDGQSGCLSYYDKATKDNVPVGNKFTFILLDQLACIKGWHDASESGIFSNEVKDTRRDPLVVKAFKSNGVLAQGVYAQIRDRVKAVGGKFHANLYIAYREQDQMKIGSIMLKGAALREWMEFSKEHKSELFKKAVQITGSKEGKKGSITYATPVFAMKEITEETDNQATELDRQLQIYLTQYLNRPTIQTAEERGHLEKEQLPDEDTREPQPFTGDDTPSDLEIPW